MNEVNVELMSDWMNRNEWSKHEHENTEFMNKNIIFPYKVALIPYRKLWTSLLMAQKRWESSQYIFIASLFPHCI